MARATAHAMAGILDRRLAQSIRWNMLVISSRQ
jgi:hypothetical protein